MSRPQSSGSIVRDPNGVVTLTEIASLHAVIRPPFPCSEQAQLRPGPEHAPNFLPHPQTLARSDKSVGPFALLREPIGQSHPQRKFPRFRISLSLARDPQFPGLLRPCGPSP